MKNLRNGRTQAQYGADIQSVQNPDLPSQQFRDSLGNMGDQDEYMEQNFDYGRDDAYKAANLNIGWLTEVPDTKNTGYERRI